MPKASVAPERQLLLRILDEAYERKAWHGPTLRGSVRGLTAEQAARRPGEKRHSIHELVLHAAYWKFVVRRRLLHERRSAFPIRGRNWFAVPAASEEGWREALDILGEQHHLLRAVIESLPAAQLTERAQRLIYGIAAHVAYHAGHIQLLKRLGSEGPRGPSPRSAGRRWPKAG